ncbi:hypothetical protein ABVK25_002463 [Lepraria finkii]|uniref:Uncharacterized protein n=1 Tax=Lepraria finkii TaxID=1340010 RepID=A0ABR4BHW6_9LECA
MKAGNWASAGHTSQSKRKQKKAKDQKKTTHDLDPKASSHGHISRHPPLLTPDPTQVTAQEELKDLLSGFKHEELENGASAVPTSEIALNNSLRKKQQRQCSRGAEKYFQRKSPRVDCP